ncbi:UDP-N-acetylmuramoyl-L-alanine--D-glutamate ligase [Halalkalibacillus halophilus]|uniref:UDP-N-acetylmuramoyl-L-alanine--D-glutamate ligase n=1 Tax=Halalkalibacillus halophilus TaxID=392827 RepID=UPI00040B87A7|nr:UDP-N-acetylmuramoyl-L-alanine--D-glutamate ligase [Halalkalibacillus halophilus]
MKTLTNFPYKHSLVLGLAKSGESAANLLNDSNLSFLINDQTPLEENEIAQHFSEKGIDVVTGSHPLSVLDGVDLVIKNPGIPYDNVIIEEAMKRDIPIITEIELASYLIEGPVIAITGTNGKTTTTKLIFELLKEAGQAPIIAGNIGEVASTVCRKQKPGQPVVMELSSFQLKSISRLKPAISIVLNITEAHLDYHKTKSDYVESKYKIVQNQQAGDLLIYNNEDATVRSIPVNETVTQLPFSTINELENGAYCKDDKVYYKQELLINRSEIALPGDHNLENILASIGAAKQLNVENRVIKKVLKTFYGVEHRLQFVCEKHGRKFYNDSKATNILATSKAIASFNESTILIAGGLDRGNDFDDLFKNAEHLKALVVYGESAPKLIEAAKRANFTNVSSFTNLQEATERAYQISASEDIILLSPACASWDQFPTFEARGDMFINLVHKL